MSEITKMKDFLGREVNVGDRVAFITPYGHILRSGRVEAIILSEYDVPLAKIGKLNIGPRWIMLVENV